MSKSPAGYVSRNPQQAIERGLRMTPSVRRSVPHREIRRPHPAEARAETGPLSPSRTLDLSMVRVHRMPYVAEGQGVSQDSEDNLAERLRRQAGRGRSLPAVIRSQIEHSLGASLADVRVHTDHEADSAARALNARAFAIGRDIFFRAGAYDPSSTGGRRVLAHEMAHTVQRQFSDFSPVVGVPGVAVSRPNSTQERQADAVASALVKERDLPADGHAEAFRLGDVVRSARPDAWLDHRALTDVLGGSRSTVLPVSRFTAELEDSRVFLVPEPKDTEADLARAQGGRKPTGQTLKGAKRIEITGVLPQGVIKALHTRPLNCAQFVKTALEGTGKLSSPAELSTLLTPTLWKELLRAGFRISGVWLVNKSGEVVQGPIDKRHKIATPQSPPKLGDIVFMSGGIHFIEERPKIIDPEGTNFTVTWDHVGIFIVRDRQGRDWHLAKDGDENPLGMYHTGMKTDPESGLSPGAYVSGVQTLLMYLTAPTTAPGGVPDKAQHQ